MSSFSSPIKSSLSNPPPSPIPNSPLKTTLIVAVTAAAVFISQLNLKHARAAIAATAPRPSSTAKSKFEANPKMVMTFEQKVALKAKNIKYIRALLETKLKEKKLEDAVKLLDKLLRLEPSNKVLRIMAARLSAFTNNNNNPRMVNIESFRALLELKLEGKKFEEALEVLDKLMRLEPKDEYWPFLKACLLFKANDHVASKKAFHEIISKDPFNIKAYYWLIILASKKKTSKNLIEAEEKIKEGLQKAKKSKKKSVERELNDLLAKVMVFKKDYDNALRIYKDLIKEEPTDHRPYLNQGIVYTRLKKYVDAKASFEKYKTLFPKGVDFVDKIMRAAKLSDQKKNAKLSDQKKKVAKQYS